MQVFRIFLTMAAIAFATAAFAQEVVTKQYDDG